jgi:mercuric transport protein
MATATLKVTGMSCGHCVQTVKQALEAVDGVERANVQLEKAQAVVDYDERVTNARALANAVMDEGYVAEETHV